MATTAKPERVWSTPQFVDGVQLPTPEDLPEASVLIFDGQCKFCRAQVARIHRWDGGKRVAYLSLHDPAVAARYPDLTHDMLMEQMYLIEPSGARHPGAAAFRRLTTIVPWLYVLAPVMHIPFTLPVWRWMYRQVAKRRYMWGKIDACETGACDIHFK